MKKQRRQLKQKRQPHYEYVLPQDKQRIIKEAGSIAYFECISDLNQHAYLTHTLIEERAIDKCKQLKEKCKYDQVCNDIEAFNKMAVLAYTGSYVWTQKKFQEHPHLLQAALEEIALHGIDACLQALLHAIDLNAADDVQQQSEVL